MTHFTALIMSIARNAINARDPHEANKVVIDQHQSNGAYGIHQARVTLNGDPTIYRLILAPADAPIEFGGVPADRHFAAPLVALADASHDSGEFPRSCK